MFVNLFPSAKIRKKRKCIYFSEKNIYIFFIFLNNEKC